MMLSARVALDVAGIFFGLGELQQLGHDLADAVDLLVEQVELGARRHRLVADQIANDVQIALHDRDRIVDLVRDARGDLADRGELFGNDQLLGRGFELPVGELQFARALVDPRVEFFVPFPKLAVALLQLVEQVVEMSATRPISSLAAGRSVRAPRSPLSTFSIVSVMRSSGLKIARAQRRKIGTIAAVITRNATRMIVRTSHIWP